MKVESKASGPCRVKLIVKAEAPETRPDYEKVVAEVMQHGRLPGFRAGKIPRAVVERRFRADIDAEARGRLINRLFRQAAREQKLAVVAVIDVTDVIFSPATGISFTMLVDVAPEFTLPKYKKIPLRIETPAVTDAELEVQTNRFRNMLAKYDDAAEQPAARGDLVSMDFTATCDGKPLTDVAPDARGLASGTDFLAQVEEPDFIPGLAAALEGVKAGDEKIVPVSFGKDFREEALRGRKAEYAIKIKSVRRRTLPDDAVVCQQLQAESMDQVRERLRANLLREAERKEAARQQQEVIEFLLKRTEFDLPESLVAEETNLTMRGMLREYADRGGTREQLEKSRDAILGAAAAASKDRVRLRYVLARIAEEEKIEVSEAELDGRLELLAGQYQMPVEKLRAAVEEKHGMESIRADIRNEKTLAKLVADARER
jgi:trigger factor